VDPNEFLTELKGPLVRRHETVRNAVFLSENKITTI
jgi:hypothetical protein